MPCHPKLAINWALAQSAHDVLGVFTFSSQTLYAQCTDCVHKTFLWCSDIPMTPERYMQTHSVCHCVDTAIMCLTRACFWSFSGAAGDQTVLPIFFTVCKETMNECWQPSTICPHEHVVEKVSSVIEIYSLNGSFNTFVIW